MATNDSGTIHRVSIKVGTTFAGYIILRILGSGGMAEVYLAQHPRLPRNDALKVMSEAITADTDFCERFHREADLAATLWHPYIVGVHDRGEFEGHLWISMDYVEGTDAAQLVKDRYPAGMPIRDASDIVTAVADALDYAHKRELMHRDVKPANILLTEPEDGKRRILLGDFGIARPLGDISGLTATNFTVGTLAYAAPEQLMGAEIDGRADQYALAATAFHLLTGVPPYQHSNPVAVISQHLNAAPPKLSDRRPELAHIDQVLSKAMAKAPIDRFSRCLEFALALAERTDIAGEPRPAAPTTPAPVSRPAAPTSAPRAATLPKTVERQGRDGRRLMPVVAAVVLVLTATVILVWRPWEMHHSESSTSSPPSAAAPSGNSNPAPPQTAAGPPPLSATKRAPAGPPPEGQPVDPASVGPAEGSSCSHAQHNNVTISNSGTIVRCVSGPTGFWWQPDTGQQAEPAIVGQQGWAACLKSYPQAQCVMSAVAVAGGINPAGPVYPPGAYAVPATMPYGTYGASIDFGTGQFSNGTAAFPCTYAAYDAAGNIIYTGTFSSYSQASPQAVIDRNTTLFRTSGCTPWALAKTN